MSKLRSEFLGLLVAAVVVSVIAGCSGSGGSRDPETSPLGKIHEYVGRGYEGERPLPSWLGGTEMQTRASATNLKIGGPPRVATVAPANINWFRIPAISVNKNLVVTLQPTANEDSDLFVLEGEAGRDYADGISIYGNSRRMPQDSTAPDDHLASGYAPDWVAFNVGPVERAASYVAVYGHHTMDGVKHFRIEADSLWAIQVNGFLQPGQLAQGDSHWYRFNAANGTTYTLNLNTGSGDADMFVYDGNSYGYVGKNTAAGGGMVTFTATTSGLHYVRVYGYTATVSQYTLEVNSP